MKTPAEQLAAMEEQRDRQQFMLLPIETRLRNTCPGCGCRLIRDDFTRALAFVLGPEKTGRCSQCGWTGVK